MLTNSYFTKYFEEFKKYKLKENIIVKKKNKIFSRSKKILRYYINMIANVITSAVASIEKAANPERFTNHGPNSMNMMSNGSKGGVGNFLIVFIAFLIIILILALVGQFLWNYCMTGPDGLFKAVNPCKSIWQILALYILVALFIGTSH
tara:strand:+ start:705 stop:1151 length:447 start_codon:yes stop_codon:yes gene_type:complete